MGVKSVVTMGGRVLNEVLSLIVFSVLDMVDVMLCYVYKVADFLIEAEWKPCYCSSAKETITTTGNILLSHPGEAESTIVRLTCTKLQLEEISDTLYTRPSLVSEVSKSAVVRSKKPSRRRRSTFTVNSTVIDMLQGRIGGLQSLPTPRWSDCSCKTCTSWTSSCKETLFVKVDGARGNKETYIQISSHFPKWCFI